MNISRKLGQVAASLLLTAAALAPAVANANCVPAITKGWKVPFTMTTLNKGAVSTFTKGFLTGQPLSVWTGTAAQLFSDRLAVTQPFDVNSPDFVNVQIPLTRAVKITLLSQGSALVTFIGKCDATTGLLYGSASFPPNTNDTMLIVSFGTPFKPLPS